MDSTQLFPPRDWATWFWFHLFRRLPFPAPIVGLVARLILAGSSTSVSFDRASAQFLISTEQDSLYCARKDRLPLYFRGIESRLSALAAKYMGDDLVLPPGALVIDVGANIGEFSIWCAKRGADVISFEPDPTEFAALHRNANLYGFEAVWGAVTETSGTVKFFLDNDSADSSLFPRHSSQESVQVPSVALGEWLREKRPEATTMFLLKLEAEGAEPEVLRGLGSVTENFDWVTADLGEGRGTQQDNNVAEVVGQLFKIGFTLTRVVPPRLICLFKNETEGKRPS